MALHTPSVSLRVGESLRYRVTVPDVPADATITAVAATGTVIRQTGLDIVTGASPDAPGAPTAQWVGRAVDLWLDATTAVTPYPVVTLTTDQGETLVVAVRVKVS